MYFSFAGIGLGSEDLEKLKAKVMSNKKASERWIQTKVLIIDESKFSIYLFIYY